MPHKFLCVIEAPIYLLSQNLYREFSEQDSRTCLIRIFWNSKHSTGFFFFTSSQKVRTFQIYSNSCAIVGAFVKFEKQLLPSSLSSWNNSAPTGRDYWNLIFQYFSKICRENSGFIKVWQEWRLFYMKTYAPLLWHFAQFFLEWEMFYTNL